MRILIDISGHGYIRDVSVPTLQQHIAALVTAAETAGINLRADLQCTEPGVDPEPTPKPPADSPALTHLVPIGAVCGSPDLTLHVHGTGFTAASVILFNASEEPTAFVSPTELTTLVKPSLAATAVVVPVSVVGAPTSLDFTFAAPAAQAAAPAQAAPAAAVPPRRGPMPDAPSRGERG